MKKTLDTQAAQIETLQKHIHALAKLLHHRL
jgi:hypothetical protein